MHQDERREHKALVTLLREHYTVKVKTGVDLEVHGNLLDHEYTI